MGADEIATIPLDAGTLDCHAIACLLAAYARWVGGADLVLCGRQASDDDQGIVPALLGEMLNMPVVTVARAVELASGAESPPTLRVTRVTPDGDEIVETPCPAVVTISNELGTPRYPTTMKTMKARKKKPTVATPLELSLRPEDFQPRVTLTRQYVSTVQGDCEFITGETAAEMADGLIARLRESRVLE